MWWNLRAFGARSSAMPLSSVSWRAVDQAFDDYLWTKTAPSRLVTADQMESPRRTPLSLDVRSPRSSLPNELHGASSITKKGPWERSERTDGRFSVRADDELIRDGSAGGSAPQ